MKYKYKNKLKRFLKNFPNAIICQKKGNLAAAGMEKKTLKTLNWKDDVYFYVNGGTKEKQVKTINSLYIDLDAGRDSEGMYLPYSEVIEKKNKMLERINQFPFAPSIIVETRNGYHLYWLLQECSAKNLRKKRPVKKKVKYPAISNNQDFISYTMSKFVGKTNGSEWDKLFDGIYYGINYVAYFKVIEKIICTFFSCVGADASTIKINQIMRLPYSVWHKRYEGILRPFFVKPIKEEYNTVYSINEVYSKLRNFPIKSELFNYTSNTNRSVKKPYPKSKTRKFNSVINSPEYELLPPPTNDIPF